MGNGVIDGARTRDNQNHNLGLYQLSYDHQPEGVSKVSWLLRQAVPSQHRWPKKEEKEVLNRATNHEILTS